MKYEDTMCIMHGGCTAAIVNIADGTYDIIDDKHLPYTMRGVFKPAMFIERFKDWLSSRVLDLSRTNAKVILNVAAMPQMIKATDRVKIALACNALTMRDTYWVKPAESGLRYKDVSLREHRLSDVCFDIAILGKYVSATADELKPELVTNGMFPKYWRRNGSTVSLCKSEIANAGVQNEIDASNIFQQLGIPCVTYRLEYKDYEPLSVCDLVTDESLVEWWEIDDFVSNQGLNPLDWRKEVYGKELANMCIGDYITANTDRHVGNFGVIVNADGSIQSFAPCYDFNQCLIADEFGTVIDDLMYDPLGMKYSDAIVWAIKHTSLNVRDFECHYDSKRVLYRLNKLKELQSGSVRRFFK